MTREPGDDPVESIPLADEPGEADDEPTLEAELSLYVNLRRQAFVVLGIDGVANDSHQRSINTRLLDNVGEDVGYRQDPRGVAPYVGLAEIRQVMKPEPAAAPGGRVGRVHFEQQRNPASARRPDPGKVEQGVTLVDRVWSKRA